MKTILNWIMYSGINVTIKLNPFHWRLSCAYNKINETWENDALVIELFPITIRLWINDGQW